MMRLRTLILFLLILLASQAVSSQENTTAAAGRGASYWGPIPSRADSVTAAMTSRGRPAWETALLVPYRVVGIPFSLFRIGFKGTFIFLDESKTIYRVGRLIGPRRGPFGILMTFQAGGLSGLGGGLTAVHDEFFGSSNRFRLAWQSTSTGSHKVNFGLQLGKEDRPGFDLGAGYRLRANARFFGLGPDANESDEAFYTQEASWAGLSYRHPFGGSPLRAETGVTLSGAGARGPGDKGDASIDEVFGVRPFGFHDHSAGVSWSFSLIHDTTDNTGHTTSGGNRQAKISFFQSTEGDGLGFWTYRGDVEQFISLLHPKQVLALRGLFTWMEPTGSQEIPFQRLLVNDDPDLLRGYRDFRWRDRGLTTATIEYRWPIWGFGSARGAGVDAYFLADIGQVFDDTDEIAADNLTKSYGVGLRLIDSRGFIGRLEIAWSDEETVVRLRGDQVFQFAKSGLFYGRDQNALR